MAHSNVETCPAAQGRPTHRLCFPLDKDASVDSPNYCDPAEDSYVVDRERLDVPA